MASIVSSVAEFEQLMLDVLPELKEIALEELKKRVSKYNLKLTDELYDSFKAAVIGSAGEFQHEMMLGFKNYGRFKDLKWVEYGAFNTPKNEGKKYDKGGKAEELPVIVEQMKLFINKAGGLGKFKYIPGYFTNTAKRMPVNSRAIERLAWTLAVDRMKKVRVRNRKGGWYNEARGAIVSKGAIMIRARVKEMAVKALVAQATGEINIM